MKIIKFLLFVSTSLHFSSVLKFGKLGINLFMIKKIKLKKLVCFILITKYSIIIIYVYTMKPSLVDLADYSK